MTTLKVGCYGGALGDSSSEDGVVRGWGIGVGIKMSKYITLLVRILCKDMRQNNKRE